MKRRILFAVLSVLLVVSTLLAPVSALAARGEGPERRRPHLL